MTNERIASIGLLALTTCAAAGLAQDAYRQSQDLASPSPAASDAFGTAVALFGDDAAVATFLSETVYTYERGSTGQLLLLETLTIPDPGAFGESLSIGGEFLVIGAPAPDITNFNQGVAYVYQRRSSGWRDRGWLTSSDVQQTRQLGHRCRPH